MRTSSSKRTGAIGSGARALVSFVVWSLTTATAWADSVTLYATQDAWMDQVLVNQSANHGSDVTLQVKGRATFKRRALVEFDVSSLDGCTITSATLRLHVDSNSLSTSVTHRVHRLLVDWTEGGATWLLRDGTNAWGAPGAGPDLDFDSSETDIATTGTGAGFVDWDVTPDVQSFADETNPNHGWLVKHATEGGVDNNANLTVVSYASREASTSANQPQLIVEFSACAPTPTETPTASDTPTDTPTPADTPTDTPTAIDTATDTPTPADTPTDTPTAIDTPTPTPTDTVGPAAIGCDQAPRSGCNVAGKSILLLKDKDPEGPSPKDKLIWKWLKGPEVQKTQFGDPGMGTTYSLCIYAGPAQALSAEAVVHGSSAWKALGTKGYKFKDQLGTNDGVKKVLLKGGGVGRSKVLIKGKGGNLPRLGLPYDETANVLVQLHSSDTVDCFEATFPPSSIKRSSSSQYKAKK